MGGWSLTDETQAGDGEQVLTLQELIRTRMDERGWSYADLARASGGRLSDGRWQQLGSGIRQRTFPEKAIPVIAETLDIDITVVVLAAAKSLGYAVRLQGPLLAQLLPAGTDLLSERMRSAILAMIRAAVEDVATRGPHGDDYARTGEGGLFELPSGDTRSLGSNATKRVADSE
jgi:hypothetical protein